MSSHPIVHVDIPATDRKALSEFYKNTFGWNLNLEPSFDYLQFNTGSDPDGAFVTSSEGAWAGAGPNSPILYIGTDDLSGDLVKIEAAGCQIFMPKMEVLGVGWMALFRDPSGNHIGLFQYMQPRS